MLGNRIPIICLFFILLWAACSDNASRSLAEADSLLVENPDSALSIVEAVNPEDLSQESDKALYALLLTEARYKTGTDETNDSLITLATDYYHLQDRNPLRARAYYQKGMIESNAKEYSDALLSMMIAEETATAVKDTLLLALIHRSMGDAFENMRSYRISIDYYQKSYDEFRAVNDSVYTLFALYDLARAYHNATEYQVAIDTANVLLTKAEDIGSIQFIPYCLDLLGDCYQSLHANKDAISILTRLHKDYPKEMKPSNWDRLGLAYLNSGDLKKAQECEDSLKAVSDEQWWLSYRIADAKGDYPKALALLEVEYHDENKIFLDWISRRSEKGLLDQYALLKESSDREKRDNRMRLILIIIIGGLLSVIAFMLFKRLRGKNVKLQITNRDLLRRKNELQDRENELLGQLRKNESVITGLKKRINKQEEEIFELHAKINVFNHEIAFLQDNIAERDVQHQKLKGELDALDSLLAVREKAISEVREKLRRAVSSGYGYLDSILKVYYDAGATEAAKKDVMDSVSSLLRDIREEKRIVREFEESVDSFLDNLITNLRRDFPKMKDYYYEMYLLLVLGFTPKAVSAFQGIGVETFYNRKASLIRKLKGHPTPSGINYLDFM